jgi:hypothetical protein
VKVVLDDGSPEAGATILAGDKVVGTMGSAAGERGLALIRIDRVADALKAGARLTAGGLTLRLAEPDAILQANQQSVA